MMTFIGLLISILLILIIFLRVDKMKNQGQIKSAFTSLLICLLISCIGLFLQISLSSTLNISPIYFDYFVYIGTCFLPVALYKFSKAFSNTKYNLNKKLLIIPILSLILLWTSDYHTLFYKVYSTNFNDTIYGWYFYYIHSLYTYLLFGISFINLIKYSIKNAGLFSKQAILFLLGSLIPVIVNIFGTFGIISMSIYITPICFAIAMVFYALAIFKFDFLKVAPIALQRVVDRISDSYIVVNEENIVTDFNQTFLDTFKLSPQDVRNKTISSFLTKTDASNITRRLQTIKKNHKQVAFNKEFTSINKVFTIEISSIIEKKNYLGTLILFKDITQHEMDKKQIEDNQEMLVEKERLASLGQMIGGIAHNLKTPIFSVAGAVAGLEDLINEYDSSIEDPNVNDQDMHEIAEDMKTWTKKIQSHISYMSDVITAVKGQAVALSETQLDDFTVDELFKRVDILMRHEIKQALVNLNIKNKISKSIVIHGNVNALVQVINNLISNSIDAYNGKANADIDLIAEYKDKNLIISVKDYGPGLPLEVKEKLFKEMVTTKGKDGTGLGLFMSYSNIKAHFSGTMTFESEENKGTTFNIIIPIE